MAHEGNPTSQSEQSIFEIDHSIDEEEQRERYYRVIDEFAFAPFRIMWEDWRAKIGITILIGYILMATVGVVMIDAPNPNSGPRMLSPFVNWQYPLGTDGIGQGILASVVHATPAMLKMIASGALFATFMGTAAGTVSGYVGGRVDAVLTVIMDSVVAIPGMPLMIVIGAIVRPENPFLVGLLLTINVWAGIGRAIRSEVLTLRNSEYVEASRIIGISKADIILKDVLPNIMPYILVKFVNSARFVIFNSVGLYFLGVLPFSDTNWGVMMNIAYKDGGLFLGLGLHWIVAPMVAIILLSLGLMLTAQSMDRIFNPRTRARHAKSVDDTTTTHTD